MILSGVDFPAQVLDAIDAEKLVVFAGAGVSMGAPSDLPSFRELAADIATGTGLTPHNLGTNGEGVDIWEPLDQFLGRLPQGDDALRKKAAELIDKGSPHTELHLSLVRLFKNQDEVRLVTTNFDLLFEAAATELWGAKPDIYSAPALPLGSSFEGVVHIHGAINPANSIVLTDSDFGRAYLTQGWARRFLVDLFEHYTVLFVGYSHDDTVLQYLARALPDKAKGKRFAMVGADESPDRWNLLGIDPIRFDKEHSKDFSTLYSAISQLANFASRPHSEWQEKVGLIASK